MVERGRTAHWLLLAAAVAVLIGHSLAYNFVTDDAYISFVYSRNFAEHGELTFNLGDRVEGYTNFLWTLVLGLLMMLGVAPEVSSRVVGTLCAIVTLWLVARITARASGEPRFQARSPGAGRRSLWSGLAPLLLASSSGFACWTSGGLETQLFTMLVVVALDGLHAAGERPRALVRVGWALALASMTRPEGPLIAVVFGAVWIGHRLIKPRSASLRYELIAAACFVTLWAPWFGWRWWYYGYPFPNTYYVKASGPWRDPSHPGQMLANGVYYVRVWLEQTGAIYVAPLIGYGWLAGPRRPDRVVGIAAISLVVVYAAYAISVGGDFMGLHRFIMPLFAIAAIGVALGFARLAEAIARPTLGSLIVVGTVIGGLAWYGWSVHSLGVVRYGVAGAVLVAGIVVAATITTRHWRWILPIAVVATFVLGQLVLTVRSLDPRRRAADRGVIDTPSFLIAYTADRATIGRALAPCLRDDDFSIVGGAGAQPYEARMRGVDVFGLVSSRIAHEEPRIRPRAGHTKWGSEPLLASYDPTFVFSCYEIHDSLPPPPMGCSHFWRARGYELVTMRIDGLIERGDTFTYYTFLAKQARNFQCPGRVR